jgi:hypothetical protein
VADIDATEYEIRVKGRLASRWAEWFDGMTLTPGEDGTSVISGVVADQSALHGLLRKLSDLGVPLLSVTPTRPDDAEAPASTTTTHHTRRSTT